ncbi:MAG: transglycosylase domain-containing protein [bacterium]|nr:transglycosylase domain-containing protein [bacterium]
MFLIFGVLVYLFWGLPAPWNLTSTNYPVSTKIFDRNGQLLYEIYTEQNRTPVNIADLPEYVKWAAISAEDKEFYSHHGFSWRGIMRAAFNTVFRQHLEGGSTITQQLVKNALLTQERTIKRKARESALTLAVEAIYPKDKILEMYLNHAPYGGTAWGIEAAAKTYFGKNAKDLSLGEAALLASLPSSPTRYSPFGAHPELTIQKQEFVLGRMVENKFISQKESETAKETPLVFAPQANQLQAPHFVMYVKDQLVEKYGEKMVEQGGLRVTTTLDLALQDFAQATVASEVAKLKSAHVTNGATLVTTPETGEILAMVGSKDYFDKEIQGNYNVTTALRQPGSSIKPINYALGLMNKKITLATAFNDLPTCYLVPGQKTYCPSNYDNSFHGPVQARFALGNSYNIPAVKMLALNRLDEFVPFAQKMGLSTLEDPKNYGLSLTLGGGEVKMIDMAVAFGDFANLGVMQPLVSILKVEDYQGKVLEQTKIEEGERVIPMEVAYLISHTLLDNNARSATFGSSSYLVVKNHPEVSVKTGTTNDKRDNWTIGYNPEILVVVWVGNNDNTPMSAVASGVTGASPVWNKIISYALKDKKQNWPMRPEDIVGANICSLSGKAPGDSGCPTRFEYFIKGTVPTETENLKQAILINKDTGQPVPPGETPPNVEPQEHQVLVDPLGASFCLDCPLPLSAEGKPIYPVFRININQIKLTPTN